MLSNVDICHFGVKVVAHHHRVATQQEVLKGLILWPLLSSCSDTTSTGFLASFVVTPVAGIVNPLAYSYDSIVLVEGILGAIGPISRAKCIITLFPGALNNTTDAIERADAYE
jgi:hypothetical protein